MKKPNIAALNAEDSANFWKKKFKTCRNLLQDLAQNADEDCPAEYRTDHLRTALTDSLEFLKLNSDDKHS